MKIKKWKNYLLGKRFWLRAFLVVAVIAVGFYCVGGTPVFAVDSVNDLVKGTGWEGAALKLNTSADQMSGKSGSIITNMSNPFVSAINWFLFAVFSVLKYIFAAAGLLLDFAINPKNMSDIIDRPAIYDMWTVVRDFLNLSFILVLLYSAFCTIFQIETYHIKKIIIILVVMALLVNFSFPIARFIIDASNVMMFYFLNNVFGDMAGSGSISGRLSGMTHVADVLVPDGADSSTTQLLMAIVFLFILMLTILVLAVLFVIRAVALALIIVFSPIGFVGNIMPGKMKTYANEWWDYLLQYAFFGPIMAFMIGLSFKFMAELNSNEAGAAMRALMRDSNNYTDKPGNLANLAFFSIPIIILWTGMLVSTKMKIFGASAVTGAASTAAKWARKLPLRAAKYGANATGIPGGIKKGWEDARKGGKIFGLNNKFTQFALKDKQAEREARIAGGISGGVGGWKDAVKNKKADEFRERYKKEAEKHDNIDATGASGLVSQILDADLQDNDPAKRGAAAVKVASMVHALKSGDKKDEFELALKSTITATNSATLSAMANDAERDVFIKKEMAKSWKVLNSKAKEAHKVATTGNKSAIAINKASAITSGAINVWT